MQRRFAIFDVFTDCPLAGNQLAIVFDSDGLDGTAMQVIAREFGFSETVFLSDAEDNNHSAKVRIFTPMNELPFAGHPTVGAAIAVAKERGMENAGQGIVVLEEGVGPVRCGVRFTEGAAYAEFDLPILAKQSAPFGSGEDIAAALSLDIADLGFENHKITHFNGGLDYVLVPVRDLTAIAKASPALSVWSKGFGVNSGHGVYVYCRETVGHNNQFHARMFDPEIGIPEDPATGSAVASIAGAISFFDDLTDGLNIFQIEQGIEMGRPSLITLEIEMAQGEMKAGRIGGNAVEFARGTIEA